MRSFLLIALATSIACEVTDESTTSHYDDSSDTENARQTPDEMTDLTDVEEMAGGIHHHPDGLTWFEDFENHPYFQERSWDSAPLALGRYAGTVVKVLENECKFIDLGEEFRGRLHVNSRNETILNGGLLEARGNFLRYNRVSDAPIDNTDDCYQVESRTAHGIILGDAEMHMDFVINVELEGSDCPVVEPCRDVYSAHFSHVLNDLDDPFDTGNLPEFDPSLGDEIF